MMNTKYTEILKQISDRELLLHLYFTQLILLVIAAVAGFFLFDHWEQFSALFQWDLKTIVLIGGGAGLLVVGIDMLFMRYLPSAFYDDGGVNERIFRNRNVFHIALIALVVAISEELLFRGVIQTHFGLVITSIIFALIHYRYLFNWFLFINVMVLSFFIGFIFMMTENLPVTIFMHFIIDFLLGIIIMLRNRKTSENGRDIQ